MSRLSQTILKLKIKEARCFFSETELRGCHLFFFPRSPPLPEMALVGRCWLDLPNSTAASGSSRTKALSARPLPAPRPAGLRPAALAHAVGIRVPAPSV